MCVIIAKNKGIEMPDKNTMQRCWDSNIDGAGFSVTGKNGKIEIYKGFMTFADFYKKLCEFGKEHTVVIHFRRTTQGTTVPQLTHPFPLSSKASDMGELFLETNCAICHNGDVPMTGTIEYKNECPNDSDTSIFIRKFMTKIIPTLKDLEDTDKMELIKYLIGPTSKMAIHTANGIKIVGMFNEKHGLYFSNFTNAVIFDHFTDIK